MIKKFMMILLFVINISYVMSGCNYVAYKNYYSETNDYKEVWNLTGFNHAYEGVSPLFPEGIDGLEVREFFCRYDEQLPLGEGIQIYLEVQYKDEEVFDKETNRISSMTVDCNSCFGKNELQEYATSLGEDFFTEYALVNETEKVIYYIYLQNIPPEEVEFENKLLPKEYDGLSEIVF